MKFKDKLNSTRNIDTTPRNSYVYTYSFKGTEIYVGVGTLGPYEDSVRRYQRAHDINGHGEVAL